MPITRRQLLSGALGTGAALSVLPAGGCGNDVAPAPFADLTYGATGTLAIELFAFPDLLRSGGAITIRLRSESGAPLGCAPTQLLVANVGSAGAVPQLVATTSICPHAGCPLGFSRADHLIECPCHDSRFGLDGRVLHAPARADLTLYPVTVSLDGQRATIQLSAGDPADPPTIAGVVTVDVTQPRFSALATPGGVQVLRPPGFHDCLIVARLNPTTAAALTVICTHLQCPVGFDGQVFICPCHGSRFGLDGAVLRGPAAAPLRRYPTTVNGTTILIRQA